MAQLDFAAVQHIRATLATVELEDLVAVFSRRSGEDLLFVYNTQSRPATLPDHCTAITLEDFNDLDLSTYDGVLAGISALDVIRDDLVTKGPHFFPLERIFLALERRPLLHRTWRNLARYLVNFSNDLAETDSVRYRRSVIKTLQLAVPALLDERGAEGLVAVRPGNDLAGFVAGTGGQWLTVADDLTSVDVDADGWLLALEELRCFSPQVDPDEERFIPLRSELRGAGQGTVLSQTCASLAWRCIEQTERRPDARRTAWALMTEAWLSAEDVADLVAFLPHADFEHFAATGEGLRIYRTLDEATASLRPGPRWPLAALDTERLPETFRSVGFSLVPLGSLLPSGSDAMEPADLGWLLWQAGHDTALAQTAWLLARDGLDGTRVARNLPPEVLVDLAQRAVVLISLADPWGWRQGRHDQLVASAYETLNRALAHQAQLKWGPVADYCRGVAQWYACYDADDIRQRLRRMVAHLREFRRTAGDQQSELKEFLRNVHWLIEVEEAALYPSAAVKTDAGASEWDRQALPGEPDRVRRMAASQARDVINVSPMFRRSLGRLLDLRKQRQRTTLYEHSVDVLQRELNALLAQAEQQRRLIFAPPHESAVLDFIYEHEIADLRARLHELVTEARLEIVLLNPRVEFLRDVDLAVEVRNTGQVSAQTVELMLDQNQSIRLLDRSPVREVLSLPPGGHEQFSYRVQAVRQPDVTFDFVYRLIELDKEESVSIRLPVRSLDEKPFKRKKNPYRFGRPIQEPTYFYGRETEMHRLLSSLARGGHTSTMLRGPRRMGKTSLLYILKAALLSRRVRRRFGIPEDWDAELDRYVPVMIELQAFEFQSDAAHVTQFLRSLLDEVSGELMPEMQAELVASFEERRRLIGASRAVLEQLKRVFRYRPDARVLVLLDEYDEIYEPHGRVLDTALRHVVQAEQRLTWIIATTLSMFRESKSYGSPWFNILDTVELGCLSWDAAQRLIEEPVRDEDVEWQSDAIVGLLEETGRHPAFLQLFCRRVIAELNEREQNYVLPGTIISLADRIVEEPETTHNHFEFYWSDTSGIGRLILLAAEGGGQAPTRLVLKEQVRSWLRDRFGPRPKVRVEDAAGNPIAWWEYQFEEGMTWVHQVVNALSFDRASRTYFFTVPLFRRWLQRRQRYENLREVALSTVAAEMERDGIR